MQASLPSPSSSLVKNVHNEEEDEDHIREEATVIHLNHAGASPFSDAVLQCYAQQLQLEQRVGGYDAQEQHQGTALDQVYHSAATLIHAHSNEIALVESATVAWVRLFSAMVHAIDRRRGAGGQSAVNKIQKKKVILVSEGEYAASMVAICQWAQAHPHEWTVLSIPSKSTGQVDLQCLQQMLQGDYRHGVDKERTLDPNSIALVCITHIPTNSGIVNPAEEIGEMIAEYNSNNQHESSSSSSSSNTSLPSILYLLDSCQSVGQRPLDVQQLHCHGLVATGRKFLRGPRGTGFLYLAQRLLDCGVTPVPGDHFGLPVTHVPEHCWNNARPLQTVLSYQPQTSAKRMEFWESNVAGRLALGQALNEVLETGVDQIHQTILQRVSYLYETLQSTVPGVRVHHGKPACGICTFSIPRSKPMSGKGDNDEDDGDNEEFWDPYRIKQLLSEATAMNDGQGGTKLFRFAISVVPATSTPLDSARNSLPNLLRISVHSTTTVREIDLVCQRLADIVLQLQEEFE